MKRPQPKGWPKTYETKEAGEKGLKMMKTFGSFITTSELQDLSSICATLEENGKFFLAAEIEEVLAAEKSLKKGPKGGWYYIDEKGKKVYSPKKKSKKIEKINTYLDKLIKKMGHEEEKEEDEEPEEKLKKTRKKKEEKPKETEIDWGEEPEEKPKTEKPKEKLEQKESDKRQKEDEYLKMRREERKELKEKDDFLKQIRKEKKANKNLPKEQQARKARELGDRITKFQEKHGIMEQDKFGNYTGFKER